MASSTVQSLSRLFSDTAISEFEPFPSDLPKLEQAEHLIKCINEAYKDITDQARGLERVHIAPFSRNLKQWVKNLSHFDISEAVKDLDIEEQEPKKTFLSTEIKKIQSVFPYVQTPLRALLDTQPIDTLQKIIPERVFLPRESLTSFERPVNLVDNHKRSGKFSSVHVYEKDGFKFARKVIPLEAFKPLDEKGREKARGFVYKEVRFLCLLNDHPHIIEILAAVYRNDCMEIVTEFANRESFSHFSKTGVGPTENIAKIYLRLHAGVISGLNYIHSKQLAHQDIKPQNILIYKPSDNTYTAKIADLGCMDFISDTEKKNRAKGTPYYMHPDKFRLFGKLAPYKHDPFNAINYDWWAYGCTLFETLATVSKTEEKFIYREKSEVFKLFINWRNHPLALVDYIQDQISHHAAAFSDKDPSCTLRILIKRTITLNFEYNGDHLFEYISKEMREPSLEY